MSKMVRRSSRSLRNRSWPRAAGEVRISTAELSARLSESGISLNDPDHLFYLPVSEQAVLRDENHPSDTRRLTDVDAAAFAVLTASAPEDDLDEAFGGARPLACVRNLHRRQARVRGEHVSVERDAARGPRGDHPPRISRPRARSVTVRAISAEAIGSGYEPQYRCQLDNAASVALARASRIQLLRRVGSYRS